MEGSISVKPTDPDQSNKVESQSTDEYTFRAEDYGDFQTLTIWGDIADDNVRELGNRLYTALTLFNQIPSYTQFSPTVWGIHRLGISTDSFVRLDPLFNGPSLTYEIRTDGSNSELGIITENPEKAINAVGGVLEVELPDSVKQKLTS